MSASAKAVVVWNTRNQAVQGLLALLIDKDSGAAFPGETNIDGWWEWPSIPDHVVNATISVWGAGYVQVMWPITLTPAMSQTIRLGDSPHNPQDILLPAIASFKSGTALPAPPSRDELCRVRCTFQGLQVPTKLHGLAPWFEPALAWPDFADDHEAVFDVKMAAGDTHVNLAVSSQYDEPGQFYAGMAGRDYTQDLEALRDLIRETICAGASRGLTTGFKILLAMAGDGMVVDPVGLTYGFDWLMLNFERIWSALRGDGGEGEDLTPWVLPMPGYDGVVPAWQPWTCVNNYVRMARKAVGPDHPLAIELASGYCVWSGEDNDWATGDGQMFDVILQEFPYPMAPPKPIDPALLNPDGTWKAGLAPEQRAPWDQVWQMVGRMIHPYYRPANQPSNDDGGGAPFLLSGGTPRGPFFYIAFEFDTYGWVRGCQLSQVQEHRTYLERLGCEWIG